MFHRKGFTLVELLVVLIIIGILVALILPNALRSIRQANTKACVSNIRALDTAIQMYYTEHRPDWPPDLTTGTLGIYMEGGTVPTCPFGVAYARDGSGTAGYHTSRTSHFSATATSWPNVHDTPSQ